MADDVRPQLDEWLGTLPPHIHTLYQNQQKGPSPLHFPLIKRLAKQFQWPDHTLLDEIEVGFKLTGPLNPGSGWKRRDDQKYQQPVASEDFMVMNEDYIREKLRHWQQLPASSWSKITCADQHRLLYRADRER